MNSFAHSKACRCLSLWILVLSACAGPERATRASTEGLAEGANERLQQAADSRGGRDPRPQGDAAGESWREFAERFAGDLVGANVGTPIGVVAVFPVLFNSRAVGGWVTSDAGDQVSDSIRRKLQAADRRVLADEGLRAAIVAANRGLRDLVNESAAIDLAGRLAGIRDVGLAVTGTIEVVEQGSFGGNRKVRFALRAVDARTGATVLDAEKVLRQPGVVAAVCEDLAVAGRWRTGTQAEPYEPSLDREFDVLATGALAQIFDRAPDLLLDRKVVVLPLELEATAEESQALRSRQRALEVAMDAAERSARDGGSGDPLQAVLDHPLTVAGVEYASGAAALQAYQDMRARAFGAGRGALAAGLSESIAETVQAMAGDRVTIVSPDDRRLAVSLVRADALEYRTEASVAADSISFVEGQAADVVVAVRLRRHIEDYVLRIRVLDLADPARGQMASVTLPSWVVGPLNERLAPK